LKLFIISGEPSGDLHGANLLRFLKAKQPDLQVEAWGGERMEEEGAVIVKHYKELAFMGFVEVIMNLPTILSNFKLCKKQITKFNPDAVILIDYPGFNLRMAKHVHNLNIKVFYYISPQVWAWKQSRTLTIKKYVDNVYSILPFEKDFFKKFDVEADFVGHPLLDEINRYQSITDNNDKVNTVVLLSNGKKILALLPGSRKQEINSMLPVMLKAAEKFTDYQVIVAGAPSQPKALYQSIINGASNVNLIFDHTYPLLAKANLALVTSGTATLEAALFRVPQIVCYKGSGISVMIARMLIKVKYISLVNLIMDAPLVSELIQEEMEPNVIVEHLKKLEDGTTGRTELLKQYQVLAEMLGGGGASELTANLMLKTLGTEAT
jgi:lipid-A-disaccharide synthase|tara:strand:- start:5591 stop:6727 length:1137 start_codon:yes stop_codon:yes gene_type:complete